MTSLPNDEQQAALERTLGVRFNERGLLHQALVHRSFLNEQDDPSLASYDRLEYLGDAYLDWVVAAELYRLHPEFDEGELTRARASLVRGDTLAEVAREIGLGGYLLLGQGEEASGGRNRSRNLGGRGRGRHRRNASRPGRGCCQVARPPLARPPHTGAGGRHGGAGRQERTAGVPPGSGPALPVYETVLDTGEPHDERFTVRVLVDGCAMGRGAGRRIADAEQSAAQEALAALRSGGDAGAVL